MTETPRPLSRRTLYELVWTEPMHTLAPRYGISDVGLAKICRRFNVPRPGRGYWARRKSGQSVRRVPLPRWPQGKPQEIVIRPSDAVRLEIGETGASVGPAVEISVAEVLSEPHKLVGQAKRLLERSETWRRRRSSSPAGQTLSGRPGQSRCPCPCPPGHGCAHQGA